ncbi:MAG: hypothetical protein MUF49_06450 [Oculatellaceae cyanobacterium Prado106]|nr:hypothetical protein [Oculatellaceae cyanobacterium Prado106]
MLTQHRIPVSLSLLSFDLPVWSMVETDATLYQKDQDTFHVLLTEPVITDPVQPTPTDSLEDWAIRLPEAVRPSAQPQPTPRLLWLELSPYRVIMTMQGNGQFSYRHYWEQGVYGVSRYWLQTPDLSRNQIRLRNFTRHLKLEGQTLPHHLRVEYELWTQNLQLGHYVLNLEIHHPDVFDE